MQTEEKKTLLAQIKPPLPHFLPFIPTQLQTDMPICS